MLIGAIDLGGTKTICAVCDENHNIKARTLFNTEKKPPEELLAFCVEKLAECAEECGYKISSLVGIGMSLPGMVDLQGNLIYAPFLDWYNVDVKGIVRNLSGVKNVKCDCDVNACALAEANYSEFSNFLWITVSTGIGGAIVANKGIFRGAHGLAGEIGHIKVEYENPKRCSCGQYGCAEAHASGTALTKAVIEMCENDTEYSNIFTTRNLTKDAVGCSVLAKEGEPRSVALFNQTGDYLGRVISTAVNLVDIEAVYIGGGMSRSLDLLLPAIRARIQNATIPFMRDIPVLPTAIGYNAALMGAFMLVGNEC